MRRGRNDNHGPARARLRAAGLAGLMAAALTAACGTVTAPGGPRTRLTDHRGGPPWTDRAGALVVARTVLSHLVLPSGARALAQRPLPPGLHQPGSSMSGTYYLDRYRLYRMPMTMDAAAAFLRAHPPAGLTLQATGTSSDRSGITERQLMFGPKHGPSGIATLSLVETIVPGPRGHALMRADAEVAWFPRRPAAEHLTGADYRSVRLVAEVYGTRLRTVARTFTSPAVIGRLTRLLNSLPASPGELTHCPMIFVSVRAIFTPAAGHQGAVVGTSGCTADSITVGGRQQPALYDLGRLRALIERLLHVPGHPPAPVAGQVAAAG